MKQRNIASSRNAETFSARRRSQRAMPTSLSQFIPKPHKRKSVRHPSKRRTDFPEPPGPLLHGVDALERAPRPVVRVLVEIFLLRERTEGVLVRRVDLLAFLLEEVDR